MTLSNALSNALSGIAFTSRATEVVASNVAGSLDPTYARRELLTSSRAHVAGGGGVRIDGVAQVIKQGVVGQNRLALGDSARATTMADHSAAMEKLIGVPGTDGSLSSVLTDFSNALIAASGRPDNEPTLSRLSQRAVQLTDRLNDMGKAVQAAPVTADRAVSDDVDALNKGLNRVSELNRLITIEIATGHDASALKDQRRALVDKLSEIVPLKELPRETGKIALMTKGGAILLDGAKPLTIGFSGSGPISPEMKVGTPPMAELTYDGNVMSDGQLSLFAGGRIDANLKIRDELAPQMQGRLDAFARDLYERVADTAVDPTRAAGAPPLLTDNGAVFNAANETGFANRISVNDLIVPDKGGASWRLRDGLGAAAPGAVGNASLINRLSDAFSASRVSSSAAMPFGQRSTVSFGGELATFAATQRLDSSADQSAAKSRQDVFSGALRADGVNTDSEMERLLALERAYAANAKVFQAVDDMISSLLRM